MLLECLYIGPAESMGRGVFTSENIDEGTIVEKAPVIIMSPDERKLLDQTILHDYIFEWGHKKDKCCIALGWISIYNHSYHSNCEYEMDYDNDCIMIRSVQFIREGEQLFINYNGTWNDSRPLWFEAI